MRIEVENDIKGSILDIGGGGEGIIGRIYRDNVIAIDNRQEELDEAPDCCEKQLMDATNLLFMNEYFDNTTFFYSLMYMKNDVQKEAIKEATRVLKRGGRIYIWDSNIDSTSMNEPYVVNLDIVWGGNSVHTSYGIVKGEKQNIEEILGVLYSNGILIENCVQTENHFFVCGVKK